MRLLLTRTAILLNVIALGILGYFVLTDFYSWQSASVWLNKDESFYGVSPAFKYILAACVILPLIIAPLQKQYAWLIQALLLWVSSVYYQTDIYQRTVLINQPTSAYRVCCEIEALIKAAENDVRQFADDINRRHISTVSQTALQAYNRQRPFDIDYVEMEHGELISISIKPKIRIRSVFSYRVQYFPGGWRSVHGGSMSELGTGFYVICCHIYSHGKYWWINVDAPGGG